MGVTNVDQLATRAKDAAYTVVGLGILGFQRLQVQRQQLRQHLGTATGTGTGTDNRTNGRRPGIPADELRTALVQGAHHLDGLLVTTRTLVDSGLEPIEDQLPPVARELVAKGRSLGTHLHHLLQSVA